MFVITTVYPNGNRTRQTFQNLGRSHLHETLQDYSVIWELVEHWRQKGTAQSAFDVDQLPKERVKESI